MFLLIQQISIVLPNLGDDPLLGDAPVLKCLNANQGLRKSRVVSLKREKKKKMEKNNQENKFTRVRLNKADAPNSSVPNSAQESTAVCFMRD